MPRKIIFQDSFLISGIMCLNGCGKGIESTLNSYIDERIAAKSLPADAKLIISSEPHGLGLHRYTLSIKSNDTQFEPPKDFHTVLAKDLRENTYFEIVDVQSNSESKKSANVNWVNIIVNLMAMGAIICLWLFFPPSILLTIGLTALSFLTTAFTAREYLSNFFHNLRNGSLMNMTTTISLGWFLSLAHTLFHAISMPLTGGFSMIFMSFVMPVMLIGFVNGMEEIKRLVLNRSKKMQLQGLKAIFPQMSQKYLCYELTQEQEGYLLGLFEPLNEEAKTAASLIDEEQLAYIDALLDSSNLVEENKDDLKKGMIIEVKRGECFPVDCILVDGNAVVDASLLTGEPQQSKLRWERILAGTLNLGQPVKVYVANTAYASNVNKLLFSSNRARNRAPVQESTPKFTYLYTGLIILGLIAAIAIPAGLGILTLSLAMQNLMGILFSVCPCTIAIAHFLPNLLGIYHRARRGVHLRDESMAGRADEINTVVFDKTGTLTTGNSLVESSTIPPSLWQRIYLLEKAHGGDHPIAKAITKYYEAKARTKIRFNDLRAFSSDSKNRGLSATVQGHRIQIGNAAYLQEEGIELPEVDMTKISRGFSPVYVAENGVCQGIVYIQHEPRKGIKEALLGLKNEGKRIIMLTGDSKTAAQGFNQQLGDIFDEDCIYAEQTPENKDLILRALMSSADSDLAEQTTENKEAALRALMSSAFLNIAEQTAETKETVLRALISSANINPKGLWFVGDGLNDAPSCGRVSEMGGISCAMTQDDKAAFFADISLNGSLDYLFHHNELNRFAKASVLQNQWIMGLSSLAFLAFIISFSIAGIAVSPLIPLAIMLTSTMFVLFNSYRVQLKIDEALDKTTSWPRKFLASNLSISILVLGASLLIGATLIATIASGGLALPALVFTAGVVTTLSSACTVTATVLLSTFALFFTAHLLKKCFTGSEEQEKPEQKSQKKTPVMKPTSTNIIEDTHHDFPLLSKKTPTRGGNSSAKGKTFSTSHKQAVSSV